MKTKQYLKIALLAAVFAISYLGFSISHQTRRIGNVEENVTIVNMGTAAEAYCNEASKGDRNNGLCTGHFEDPTTRCLEPLAGTQTLECKL